MAEKKKYVIYARVSPRGQQEHETSIQMQIDTCKEWVKAHGGKTTGVFFDEFFSGKDTKRPAFSQILLELEKDTAEWDAILCYKMSRMSRSTLDGLNILDKLQQKGKSFVSATEPLFDFSSPLGRATITILQAINQMEREQTAENTRNKMVSIAARGEWPVGTPPYGYKRGAKHDNVLYIDPVRAENVRDIFRMYIDPKHTTLDILKKHKTVAKSTMLHILENPAYIGKIRYDGKEYPGKHEAIIEEDVFARAKEKRALANVKSPGIKQRLGAQKRKYLLTGLLRCHCGRFMTPASAKSGAFHYYRCTDNIDCKNRISAPFVEDKAMQAITNFKVKEEVLLETLKKIDEARKNAMKENLPEIRTAEAAVKDWQKKQDNILEQIIDGKMTDENADLMNTKLDATRKNIETLSARLEYLREQTKNMDVYDEAKTILAEIKRIKDAIATAPDDADLARSVLACYIKTITDQKNETFKIVFNFDGKSSSKSTRWLPRQDSNLN